MRSASRLYSDYNATVLRKLDEGLDEAGIPQQAFYDALQNPRNSVLEELIAAANEIIFERVELAVIGNEHLIYYKPKIKMTNDQARGWALKHNIGLISNEELCDRQLMGSMDKVMERRRVIDLSQPKSEPKRPHHKLENWYEYSDFCAPIGHVRGGDDFGPRDVFVGKKARTSP